MVWICLQKEFKITKPKDKRSFADATRALNNKISFNIEDQTRDIASSILRYEQKKDLSP